MVGQSPNQYGPPVWRKSQMEMLSLARTSKYVDSASVLSINKTEEDS